MPSDTLKSLILRDPEVVAVLAGRATVRRAVKVRIVANGYRFDRMSGEILCHCDYLAPSDYLVETRFGLIPLAEMECPLGAVGDRRWVREAHAPRYFDDGSPGYRADYDAARVGDVVPEPRWTSSIHMRREDSRLTVEIVAVRVERAGDAWEWVVEIERYS